MARKMLFHSKENIFITDSVSHLLAAGVCIAYTASEKSVTYKEYVDLLGDRHIGICADNLCYLPYLEIGGG